MATLSVPQQKIVDKLKSGVGITVINGKPTWNDDTPNAPKLNVLERLKKRGIVRCWGNNYSA